MTALVNVVVIGGGQAGLAAGYRHRRNKLDFVNLDGPVKSGGAWQHAWDSLHLFSPATFPSLPAGTCPSSGARSAKTPLTWCIT
ncbi:hypothetical protein TNCT1_67740 [Streptomyces sp. 1-11]|nr:hypothetical protein TNCT1_67740 [Streptomyces sp. 1-11]